MTDSRRKDSRDHIKVNPEHFARFLELLAPEPEAAGHRYTALHKKLIGFFRMKGISDPENATDETIDRAVLKIGTGVAVPDVVLYCLGIARNIAKEKYRIMHREHLISQNYIGESDNSSADYVERIYRILKPCFEQLAVEEQQLLLAYCQDVQGRARAQSRRELAEMMKITVSALRIRVTRLRNSLTDCVQKQSNQI